MNTEKVAVTEYGVIKDKADKKDTFTHDEKV